MEKETRSNFNDLSLHDKAILIEGFAHPLIAILTPDTKYVVNILEIEGRFVEIFCNNKTEQIDYIWMPSYQELDCYLRYISISDLKIKTQ